MLHADGSHRMWIGVQSVMYLVVLSGQKMRVIPVAIVEGAYSSI